MSAIRLGPMSQAKGKAHEAVTHAIRGREDIPKSVPELKWFKAHRLKQKQNSQNAPGQASKVGHVLPGPAECKAAKSCGGTCCCSDYEPSFPRPLWSWTSVSF